VPVSLYLNIMKKPDVQVKLAKKRTVLIERTALALGIMPEHAQELLLVGRKQSLRLNPLRYTDKEQVLHSLEQLGWQGRQYSWMTDGYSLNGSLAAIRDSDLVKEGQVYIQNAASWLPVLALDPRPGEVILDMCAAPGGKASHIAALTNNQADLWVNDNSHPRLAKIKANFKRLNVQPVEYMLYDARYLTKKLPAGTTFDKILLDAPCSGEGMMTLDSDKDMATWSVAHIRRLQTLQKQLILQAWQLLKPGGTLVYSTCTMAPEENELVVDYLLRKADGALLESVPWTFDNQYPAVQQWNDKRLNPDLNKCLRLAPSTELEAFFVSQITKLG
jgi:tRNA (cytosine49-C5)-methyltransferase